MMLKNIILLLIILNSFSCNTYSIKKDKYRGEIEGYYEIECQSTFNSSDTLLNSQIEGYVIDGFTNTYVNECFIGLENKKFLTKTDSLGYFKVILPNGFYRFKFAVTGNHVLITDEIKLKKNTTTKLFVKLGTSWVE